MYNFPLSGFNSRHLKSSHRQVVSGSCICFKKPLCQFSTAALWPLKVKYWKYCPPQLDRSSSVICTPQVLQEGTPACCPSAPAVSDWWAPRTVRVGTAGSCFRGSVFLVSYTETIQGGEPQSMGKNESRKWTEIKKLSWVKVQSTLLINLIGFAKNLHLHLIIRAVALFLEPDVLFIIYCYLVK